MQKFQEVKAKSPFFLSDRIGPPDWMMFTIKAGL
jgi:hypothetical protein